VDGLGPNYVKATEINSGTAGTFAKVAVAGKTRVKVNGVGLMDTITLNHPNAPAGLQHLTIDGGSDPDTINVAATGVDTEADGGSGNDPIPVGTLDSTRDHFGRILTADAGFGLNTLILQDQKHVAASAWTIDGGLAERVNNNAKSPVAVLYSNISTL